VNPYWVDDAGPVPLVVERRGHAMPLDPGRFWADVDLRSFNAFDITRPML